MTTKYVDIKAQGRGFGAKPLWHHPAQWPCWIGWLQVESTGPPWTGDPAQTPEMKSKILGVYDCSGDVGRCPIPPHRNRRWASTCCHSHRDEAWVFLQIFVEEPCCSLEDTPATTQDSQELHWELILKLLSVLCQCRSSQNEWRGFPFQTHELSWLNF